MEECFPMKRGDGAYSYTKNSQLQKGWTDSVKEMIQDSVIHKLDAEISSSVTIADFGCSVGPNTFFTVQNLIEALQRKYKNDLIEFHVFFNDHSANDFNTLFASLPVPADRRYHAAGVPGSFHGRLFPRGSITVAHSAYSLNWLSKQLQGVANEGRIHYTGASEDVVRAYSDQFERDVGGFMSARAEETVSGGLVFLTVPTGNPEGGLSYIDLFGDTLMDLVNQGVVEKSAVDTFNLPLYFPKAEEMRRVVEKNGCFSIERMEMLIGPGSKLDERPIIVIKHLRAILDNILNAHFGNNVVEKMFDDVCAKAQQISGCLEERYRIPPPLFVVLKRN